MNTLASCLGKGSRLIWAAMGCFAACLSLRAAPEISAWEPIFKGIELMRGTNSTPSGDFQNRMVMYCLRVDLTDPDIRLHPSPPITNRVEGARETAGRTVSRFVEVEGVQVAVNCNFFDPEEYYLPDGTPMYVGGLQISDGEIVSIQSDSRYISSILFDAGNRPTMIHTNWPAVSTVGVRNAVTGDYPIVVNGQNIGRQYLGRPGFIHGTNPRTAMGFSADRRFLYLMCIDGRQAHSAGALDYETGAWMLLVGATEAANMDGGGSATMSMRAGTGQAIRINMPSAVADSGKERTVGSHFGVFAKPLAGFINEISAVPDDVSASITWKTTEPATTRLEYGTTPDLGTLTPEQPGPVTQHALLLRGLQPGSTYYYRAVSTPVSGGDPRRSEIRRLDTLNFSVPQEVVSLASEWRFQGLPLDGVAWMAPEYSDSGWEGPGSGLLWAYTRSGTPAIEGLGTRITTIDGRTGFPYVTYYFRTKFQSGPVAPGTRLILNTRIDDGAVVYLNGKELQRVRMDPAPALIASDTLAIAYPCSGDANCAETTIDVPGDGFVQEGTNVLAVEVHNYNARSPDITFGLSLAVSQPQVELPVLALAGDGDGIRLEWSRGGFQLEQAASPDGPWSPVPGPVVVGPHRVPSGADSRFYRLAR